MWGDVDVEGNLRQFRAVLVDGSVYVEGDLGSLLVGSFAYNDLFVEGNVLGTFSKAVATQRQAIARVAEASRAEFESRLKLYESNQPYRDVPKADVATTTAAR